MAGNHKLRKRKVDVSKLNMEQVEKLQEEIGKELSKIFDEAGQKANKLLNIYGLEIKIGYEMKEMPEKIKKKRKPKTEAKL